MAPLSAAVVAICVGIGATVLYAGTFLQSDLLLFAGYAALAESAEHVRQIHLIYAVFPPYRQGV
jgi:hypothetical protein